MVSERFYTEEVGLSDFFDLGINLLLLCKELLPSKFIKLALPHAAFVQFALKGHSILFNLRHHLVEFRFQASNLIVLEVDGTKNVWGFCLMVDSWVEFLGESFVFEATNISMRNSLPIMRSREGLIALRTRALSELDMLFYRIVQCKQIHDGLPVFSLLESQ